jgi:hypothetical protein
VIRQFAWRLLAGGVVGSWTAAARHFTPISRPTRRSARKLHGQVNES